MFARILLIGLLAATIGCESDTVTQDDLDKLEQQIMSIIDGAAATNVSFCKTVAFGSKPCGGPWRYLSYSTENLDEAELLRLIRDYNRKDSLRNIQQGGVSDCLFVSDPGSTLSNGRCVIGLPD